jgi:predicted glycoside hydrolase/deacetylase ChbG (UPF0249 family)
MPVKRYLSVNTDDLGQSRDVNRGIIETHQDEIVTSVSLMVRWPAAAEAAAHSREHPSLSIGLHVDLSEFAYRGETRVPLYEVVKLDDIMAVEDEGSCQLATFRKLGGRAAAHIDSHQHDHDTEPMRSVFAKIPRKLGVRLTM